MELNPNEPKILELRSEAIVGKNTYGDYQLFIVSNGTNEEYSFFCPNEKVFEQLRTLKRGSKFEIVKTAKQNGRGIKVDYEIVVLEEQKSKEPHKDNYFDIMLTSYQDALNINERYKGLVDVSKIATTLFIARSKVNGFNGIN